MEPQHLKTEEEEIDWVNDADKFITLPKSTVNLVRDTIIPDNYSGEFIGGEQND